MVVEIKGLNKTYKNGLHAVNNLDLEIHEKEIFGLLGPNGSGKSTTINCLLQLLNYESGEVKIFGKKMDVKSYDIKKDIGYVPQEVAVFDQLTVYENIHYFCSLYIKDKPTCKRYTEEAIELVGLEKFRKFLPKKLSGGLKRRLNIACGIVHKPKLIIFDEPTVAVDPQSRNKILENIKKLNENGSTIIYTSHYMEEVELLCDNICILVDGKKVAEGTKDDLLAMVKDNETITVTTSDDLDFLQDSRIKKKYRKGNDVIIKVNKNSNYLMDLIKDLEIHKVSFKSINQAKATLNDVFLQITGKELRD